jgi:hypothetical protein
MDTKLTGRTRYRVGFMKRLILQVEIIDKMVDPQDFSHSGPEYTFWRDATFEEFQSTTLPSRS